MATRVTEHWQARRAQNAATVHGEDAIHAAKQGNAEKAAYWATRAASAAFGLLRFTERTVARHIENGQKAMGYEVESARQALGYLRAETANVEKLRNRVEVVRAALTGLLALDIQTSILSR